MKNLLEPQTKRPFLKKKTWLSIMLILLFITPSTIVGFEAKQQEKTQLISPVPLILSLSTYKEPEPVKESEETQTIREYVAEVFGKDADKAFKVLSCENASLNPNAVNTAGNTPKGSRDIGVFQINEYWQGVNGKFLFDPEINVQIAHKIYTDNGHSFERWTCGRKLGL